MPTIWLTRTLVVYVLGIGRILGHAVVVHSIEHISQPRTSRRCLIKGGMIDVLMRSVHGTQASQHILQHGIGGNIYSNIDYTTYMTYYSLGMLTVGTSMGLLTFMPKSAFYCF